MYKPHITGFWAREPKKVEASKFFLRPWRRSSKCATRRQMWIFLFSNAKGRIFYLFQVGVPKMMVFDVSMYIFEHQKTASNKIRLQIRIPRSTFTLKLAKPVFYYMKTPKTGNVLILEHQKTALHQIWHQIRIPRPPFTHIKLMNAGLIFNLNLFRVPKSPWCAVYTYIA